MELKDISEIKYHPIQEKILKILRSKTQNLESDTYFRAIISFYLAQMSTSMRATLVTPHRGELPTNMYVLGLGESGLGKGHSMNIMERELLHGFVHTFTKHTFPSVAEQSIADEARSKAIRNATDEAEELEKIQAEFNALGNFPFSFSEGSGPAYKQVRTIAQIAGIGATNFIGDEIGANLSGWSELMAVNLESYDIGLVKDKITKNSSDNKRGEQRTTPVPSNILNFGTPSALFNGGPEEREFRGLLEMGYGRRYLYGWGHKATSKSISAEDLYEQLTSDSSNADTSELAHYFAALADEINYNKRIVVPKSVALINLQYQLDCESRAEMLSSFEPIRKAELQHRYFKAMKLAGCYAFVDQTPEVTEDQMYAAIKLVEESGEACEKILSQDKNYVRLAKYIASIGKEVTYADLVEDLPFFSGSKSAKDDMVSLARAWAHRHNIVIKKYLDDGFEVFKGERLQDTDLNHLIFSASTDLAYNYTSSKDLGVTRWEDFYKIVTKQGVHWCNHNFEDKHRKEDKALPEFNLIVIDVDDGCTIETAKLLLKEYEALYYTTKRHTDDHHRFRIILPLKNHLKMSANEFKEFIGNVYEWLPFKVDEGTDQRSKKWLSHSHHYEYTSGELLDPTQFIPKTAKNDKRVAAIQDLGNMDKIEAWFANSIAEGNRNNTMAKFTFMLYDSGMEPTEVETKVYAFNDKLKNPLSKAELQATVIKSLWSKAADDNRI